MSKASSSTDDVKGSTKSKWRSGEVRPLTTDECMSFLIVSIYMGVFCLCTFLFWDSLVLKILGAGMAIGGVTLSLVALLNTARRKKGSTIHPVLRSYMFSLFTVLLALFLVRFIGGLIGNLTLAAVVLYGGVLVVLVVFRKAFVQVFSTTLALVFILVVITNWHDVQMGNMKFKDAMRQCRHVVFRIGPIQDVANLLLTGNYMGYLSLIDYHDEQINRLAIRTVLDSNDDEWRKTEAILDYVSNQIQYISDPDDGAEHAKDPISTLLAGGGDCEDQTLLLCSLLESVGVKTYIAFTDDHVFALVSFGRKYKDIDATPHVFIDGTPCYALDAADHGAEIGQSVATPSQVKRIFDVRQKAPVYFTTTL